MKWKIKSKYLTIIIEAKIQEICKILENIITSSEKELVAIHENIHAKITKNNSKFEHSIHHYT